MPITVQLTYDMSKSLGTEKVEIEEARTVADAIQAAKARFGADTEAFDRLSRVAAVAVNGVLINYRRGMRTPLSDGDTVAFVKAAAGG